MGESESISEEQQWQIDARTFARKLVWNWHTWIGAVGGLGVNTILGWIKWELPPWSIPWIVAIGLVWGAFDAWRAQRRRAEEAEKKREELIKKQTPLFILTCNSSLPECKVSTNQDYSRQGEINGHKITQKVISRPAVWFRMIVNVECPTSIEKCTGYITKIEKQSKPLQIPEKFQVSFCSGSEPDAFSKTISKGVPEYLDIVYWEQDVGIRIPSKVNPNSVDMLNLFSKLGEYTLTVVVIGGNGVAPKEARLKFNWTGKIDTAEIGIMHLTQ